ncbi:transmembrane protein, putative (macronuclear) [Tetrahymena thermophila SB210]|uniref:Transmembrane protein, putative n=1 Tax=Tetrahymena thermophila (strain SB210) TaxID=312017 RepID=Q22WD3_TETTS|nr:transmembrane protein, putative [Tetrahymena thermophila SB210]EAR89484.1 transmembrane protein, putative [Tetrahymena thermophila SB210]|eukprot:XP_001009729.1 transmembrane protein, putative [Tetrahymena thermophila SB210]
MSEIAAVAKAGLGIGRVITILIPSLAGVTYYCLRFSQTSNDSQLFSNIEDPEQLNFFNSEETDNIPLELYLDGKRVLNNPIRELNRLLQGQQVTKIKRMAQSLWRYFPSGIASIFTQALFNQCVRHEYILVHTQDFIISAEISKTKDCKNNGCFHQNLNLDQAAYKDSCDVCNQQNQIKSDGACFQVMIWKVRNKDQIAHIKQEYKKRSFSRILKKFSLKHQNIDDNFQINKLLLLWTIIIKVYQISSQDTSMTGKFYNIFTKNCKTFARANLYFLQKKLDVQKVFESIFGLFCDKPGYIFFDYISAGVQASVELGLQNWNENFQTNKKKLEDILKQIRNMTINY